MITHNEVTAVLVAGGAFGCWFLGWLSRGPRARSLDDAFDKGYDQRAEDDAAVFADNYSPPGEHRWDDEAGRWVCPDRGAGKAWPEQLPVANKGHTGPGHPCSGCGVTPHPDPSADERLSHERHCPLGPRAQGRYPHGDDSAGRTIYPELSALGAEIDAEPPEAVAVRLDETTEEWAARMEMKAAIWCADNGVEREAVRT